MVEKIRTVLDDPRTNEQFKDIQLELLWRSLESTNRKTSTTELNSGKKDSKKKTRKEKNRERKEKSQSVITKKTKSLQNGVFIDISTRTSNSSRQATIHKMALRPPHKVNSASKWPTWEQVKANKVIAVPKESPLVEEKILEPETTVATHIKTQAQVTVQSEKIEGTSSSSIEILEKRKIESVTLPDVKPKLERFRWPSTIAYQAEESMPESNWPKVGMLSAVGYSVGMINGLGIKQRQELLSHVYSQVLPLVDSRQYVAEWGEPSSSKRLKKMAETIAALVRNAKRKKNDMSVAIFEWEQDLAWLKEKYYLQHKFVWIWPKSVLPSEEKANCQHLIALKAEKNYLSSREFLVEQYTNDAKELCCQICESALPFKLQSGEYYFEEIRAYKLIEQSVFSYLVLCPNHRAMYQFANNNEIQLLGALGNRFKKEIQITLAQKNHKIFITEKHQTELRKLRTELDNHSFELIDKSLLGVSKVHLYELNGKWVLASRRDVKLGEFHSKEHAQNWLERFDVFRKRTLATQVKETKPKANVKKKVVVNDATSKYLGLGSIEKLAPQSSYQEGFIICNNCHGDGGINGGCWKCGGSGWM
ncbi:hypothetical protein RAX56_002038 [Vibrio fluvialis]|nr:hypothetical protein [Vibrio fluvialis]ELG2962593.1 hypothetical protein [Vibrio fluvialis]